MRGGKGGIMEEVGKLKILKNEHTCGYCIITLFYRVALAPPTHSPTFHHEAEFTVAN